MRPPLDRIQRLVTSCDPQKPLEGGSHLYIPLDRDPPVRGEQSSVDLMRRTILTSAGASCQLFTGFPGTGKTTELKRLAHEFDQAQAPNHGYVLFIDFEEYIQRYETVSVTDVLRVIAYCVAAEADRVEERDGPPGEKFLRDLFDLALTHVPNKAELKRLGFDALGAKLMLEIRNNPTFHAQIEAAIRIRFQHFVDQCTAIISSGIQRIRRHKGSRADRFIIIADGLEKLDSTDPANRERTEESVESLFVAHGEFLKKIPCHTIYTFPVWLRFRTAQLGAIYDCEPLTLPMIKVRGRDGAPHEEGITKLYTLIERRLDRVEDIFGDAPEEALRPLLEASGGYPRDALRLVRTLLQRETQFPIGAEAIRREIRNLQRQYHDSVLGTYAELLEHVDRTHQLPNETPEQLHRFGILFSRFLVLAYRNGEEWFDLHPLVRGAPALQRRASDDKAE